MNKKIIKYNSKVHRCWDWPEPGEKRNNEKSSEYFPDKLFIDIIDYDEKYKFDSKSSIKFINELIIPEDQEVKLKNTPGCLICHNDFIDSKVNYSMIKGLCDMKTIQYYLFDKGILFREWYLKAHLKHIWINKIEKIVEKEKNYSDTEIIQHNINQLVNEIKELDKLGGSDKNNNLIQMRKDLKEWMQLRSNLDLATVEKDNIISASVFYKKFNKEKFIDLEK